MMKYAIMMVAALSITLNASAQESDKVLGDWITQDGDSKVTIEKTSNGTYEGKVIWLKEPNRENGEAKKDDKNPDEKLKSRPIMGLKLLNSFSYSEGDEEWVNGTIYDPKSGSTYKCLMWFDDDPNTLYVKGYIGLSIIGKKVTWKRAG